MAKQDVGELHEMLQPYELELLSMSAGGVRTEAVDCQPPVVVHVDTQGLVVLLAA
jgi:hypothetical protein